MWDTLLLVMCAEQLMEVVSPLCSHPAWQPQFCEVQQSQGPCEADVRGALHVVFPAIAKLLPEHVSKAIKACFLSSEVSPCSLAVTWHLCMLQNNTVSVSAIVLP